MMARGEMRVGRMSGAISGAGVRVDPDVAPLIRATSLHLRRDQIFYFHPVAVLDDLRDPLPVAMRMVALITENADRTGLVHQRRQLVELLLCLRRIQMRRRKHCAAVITRRN